MKLGRTSVGLALRGARENARLTLGQLAELSGMTISSLRRSEDGLRDLTFAETASIVTAMHLGIEDLRISAEEFERRGVSAQAESKDRLMCNLSEFQRLALEASIEARVGLSQGLSLEGFFGRTSAVDSPGASVTKGRGVVDA